MLRSLELLRGTPIGAADGDGGTLEDALFEDETWAVRYLVMDVDPGMGTRRIAVSPMALEPSSPETPELRIRLTRAELERTPELKADEPVTRAWEHTYFRAFAWPPYWSGGAALWGAANTPGMPAMVPMPDPTPDIGVGADGTEAAAEEQAAHLHFASGYRGYHVLDTDGQEAGQVDDFILDDQVWRVAYVAVSTGGWLGGKKVLVPVEDFHAGSWAESRVNTCLTREALRGAPAWEPLESIPADYEASLRAHYASPQRAAA